MVERVLRRRLLILLLLFFAWPISTVYSKPADPPAEAPLMLSIGECVHFALERNPQLTALREQHGIAAAAVVTARTYPFNPVYQGGVNSAGNAIPGQVLNSTPHAHQLSLEVQLFHQQRFRRSAACAALTKTDWEIADKELTFAVNAIRAFDGLLYREGKLQVTEEFLRLNQRSVEQVRKLIDRGTLGAADLILAQAEVNDIRAQVELNRTAFVSAVRDYYRALGVAEGKVGAVGSMDRPPPVGATEQLLALALETRPDRFARLAAVKEAESNVRLQEADRYGNPQIGPVYEYNESRSHFVGAKVQIPIPILNRKNGEILQAKALRQQASSYVHQVEVEIHQDVSLSTARVAEAQRWVQSYRNEILPALEKSLGDVEKLFQQGQAGVDVLKVLDVRRKLLRAQDGYLDALFAYTQALADLAQAVGDPRLAMGVDQLQQTKSATQQTDHAFADEKTPNAAEGEQNRGRERTMSGGDLPRGVDVRRLP